MSPKLLGLWQAWRPPLEPPSHGGPATLCSNPPERSERLCPNMAVLARVQKPSFVAIVGNTWACLKIREPPKMRGVPLVSLCNNPNKDTLKKETPTCGAWSGTCKSRLQPVTHRPVVGLTMFLVGNPNNNGRGFLCFQYYIYIYIYINWDDFANAPSQKNNLVQKNSW